MKHLEFGNQLWCDEEAAEALFAATDDPRDATCCDCLRRAASYGAAAAMRYAAVEAGATQDPELAKERDDAIRRLDKLTSSLKGQGVFFCTGCEKLHRDDARALEAGGLAWCGRCAQKTLS